MIRRFLSRSDTNFFELFDRHAGLTVQGCKEFLSLVSTGANVLAKARRIKEIEHEADAITHQCQEALHRTFITPLERDDIHRLASRLDDVIDLVDSAAERIALYQLTQMTPEVTNLADVLVRAASMVEVAVHGLDDMRNADAIRSSAAEISRLEQEADSILRAAVARLFSEEQDTRTLIKWEEIYESLEEAADRCEDVANILEGIVLEHG
jgi:uncharacterized protein